MLPIYELTDFKEKALPGNAQKRPSYEDLLVAERGHQNFKF